jgi:DNA-binding NtrC family response regulator
MADIVFVDDDGELVQSLVRVLSPMLAPRTICAAGNAVKALELAKRELPLVAVIDLCLDEKVGVESGFELLSRLKSHDPDMRIVVLTGHGSISHGIRAMQLGASSFVEKPADPLHVAALLKDAISQADLARAYRALARDPRRGLAAELRGSSRAVEKLREEVEFAASTNQPVLLLGETGTGKSLCARLIHERSKRCARKCVFYHPNFAGGDIVQSELFGHVKGAFTGAMDSRRGLAQEADGGTLFIDELDSVPSDTQVLLLDLVQERRVRAVGSDSVQSIDCRFIAATNKPIQEALAQHMIRRDLYHRLAHCVINLPPLRDRIDDIMPLAEGVLARLSERDAVRVSAFERGVEQLFRSHSWPGNIRELQGVVENAAYRAQFKQRSCIVEEDIQLNSTLVDGVVRSTPLSRSFHEQVEAFKRDLIRHALEAAGGNQAQAAATLGIDRGTIRRLISPACG